MILVLFIFPQELQLEPYFFCYHLRTLWFIINIVINIGNSGGKPRKIFILRIFAKLVQNFSLLMLQDKGEITHVLT